MSKDKTIRTTNVKTKGEMYNGEDSVLAAGYDPMNGLDVTHSYSDEFYENFIENFQQNTKKKYCYRFFKRVFDIFASFIALTLLSPLFLVVAVAIKCDSKGPVFFKQKRVGLNGKAFTCIKFRSMKTVAPHDAATSCLSEPEQYITRVGKVLRKFSIDEFPQFYCSLIGTMSLIGYRPLVLTEHHCNEMRERLGVFKARPGISGYAQVVGRDDVYYKNKAILDAEYVKNATLFGDFKLIFQTIAVIFSKKGNDSERLAEAERENKAPNKKLQTDKRIIEEAAVTTASPIINDATDTLDRAN